jgi:hypothetical protein
VADYGNSGSAASGNNKNRYTHSVANLSGANDLAVRRDEMEKMRSGDMRDWALNRAFYRNDQWVIWNRVTSQIESLPVQEGDKPRWKVRLTANQVTPGVQHYVAQLTKNRPIIMATPDSGSDTDIKASEIASALYEWWWKEFDLTAKLQSALVHSTLSQGYWKITWDALAGKSMEVMVSPVDGRPIFDDDLASAYTEELKAQAQQMGLDPQKFIEQYRKTIYVGDIKVEVMPGENILLDPAAPTFADSQYAICKHAMDPDEIYARWKVRVPADSNPVDGTEVPLAYRKNLTKQPQVTRNVYIGYFRPQPVLPRGRVVVWIEGPNQILEDGPWPYPFSELPIVHFPGIERPNSALDDPITTLARPLQKELNRTLSQIVQHKDLMIKPQLLAPVGSLRQRLTDEPGAVFEYQPVQGLQPQWRDVQQVPNSAFNILADIQQRIDRLYNRIPSQRDQLPARVDSGSTVELIQEAVADQITPITRRLEESLARAGKIMIQLARKNYIEPRILKIYGPGGSIRVQKFLNADIAGGFTFHPQMDTGLPRTRQGKVAMIKELLQMQLIDGKTALKHLDLADVRGVQAKVIADEDAALREHEQLINGQPINPWAMQQAIQSVQQGQNPQSGQPLQSPQEAQQAVQAAALSTTDWEDWETHLRVHGEFMNSVEFRLLPVDAQQRFITHYNATYDRVIQVRQMQITMDPRALPKLGVNARATVSAPVMNEILKKHGIFDISEEEITEPPLETNVEQVERINENENLLPDDVPDLLSAQQEAEAKEQEMEQGQQAHVLEQIGKQHNLEMALASQEQARQHAEELHQAKLRQQEESHQHSMRMASKQASQPKAPLRTGRDG